MGILRITIDDSVRITAGSARLHARVKGSSALFGNAAAKKAAEVRDLVMALGAVGIGEDAVEVQGVTLQSHSGVLGKNQQVEFSLVIAVGADQLPAALGVLADRPDLTLSELEWVFDSFEASIPATAAALTKARRKADAVAAAAGSSITGISLISDSWNVPSPRMSFEATDAMLLGARSAKSAPVDPGVEFNATQELFVHLTVDFELGS